MLLIQQIGSYLDSAGGMDGQMTGMSGTWMIVFTRSSAIINVDGVCRDFPSNGIAIFKPDQSVTFSSEVEPNQICFVCFATDDAPLSKLQLPYGTPITIQNPVPIEGLFQLIAAEHQSNDVMKEISVDMMMNVLLLKVKQAYEIKPETALCKSMYGLKKEIYADPKQPWTVERMAKKLSISTGYLENVYKNLFGISCIEDVILSRVTTAKKYLKDSSYHISEIVELSGYRSSEHFYRQFKKKTGMTPNGYRAFMAKDGRDEGIGARY